jgi:hypothetical protein
LEVKKDFETFKSGDVVRLKPDYPYVNRTLLDNDIYIIDKMLSGAGVVTLKGQQWNRTFPDEAFELYDGELSGKKQ